jgi:hypothetical protein
MEGVRAVDVIAVGWLQSGRMRGARARCDWRVSPLQQPGAHPSLAETRAVIYLRA